MTTMIVAPRRTFVSFSQARRGALSFAQEDSENRMLHEVVIPIAARIFALALPIAVALPPHSYADPSLRSGGQRSVFRLVRMFLRELDVRPHAHPLAFPRAGETARASRRLAVFSVAGAAAVPEPFVLHVLSWIARHGTSLATTNKRERRNLMVDNLNPTSQFHPYQPQDATPQTGGSTSGLGGILSKLGIDQSKIGALGNGLNNVDVRGGLNKVRGAARNNPSMVLGGLAALAIGAGLMRKRSMR
jgi:hypothetical protein